MIPFIENPPPEPEIPQPDASAEPNPEKAAEFKVQALEKQNAGDLQAALNLFTEAIKANSQSAILYGNRGKCLLRMKRPLSAIGDGSSAIRINPDSAQGYRVRGSAYAMLGRWVEAADDLHVAQKIDYDHDVFESLRGIEKKVAVIKAREARARLIAEGKRRRERAAEMKRRHEESDRRKKEAEKEEKERKERGEPPEEDAEGGGAADLKAAFQDPEFVAALQDPVKREQLRHHPKWGPILETVMSAMGGMGGGGAAGGMPFGVGGGSPAAGAPPAASRSSSDDPE